MLSVILTSKNDQMFNGIGIRLQRTHIPITYAIYALVFCILVADLYLHISWVYPPPPFIG